MSVNLNITTTDAIMNTINDIAFFLNENTDMHEFTVLSNGTTKTVYKTDNYYITVRRDAYNCPYAIEVNLKKRTALTDILIKDGVIASSDPDGNVPF